MPASKRQMRAVRYGAPIFIGLLWAVLLYRWTFGFSAFTSFSAVLKDAGSLPRVAPVLALQDQRGRPTTLAILARGHYALVTFMYLRCPYVCHVVAAHMIRIHALLGRRVPDKLRMVSISVDPGRDTPEVLDEAWEAYGRPRGWALTSLVGGVTAANNKILRDFGAYVYQRPDTFYNHSAYLYLLNPAGAIIRIFQPEASPEAVAAAIRGVVS